MESGLNVRAAARHGRPALGLGVVTLSQGVGHYISGVDEADALLLVTRFDPVDDDLAELDAGA